MFCRGREGWREAVAGGDDGRGLPLHLLVEAALGLRFGQGLPVWYGIDRQVVPGRKHLILAPAVIEATVRTVSAIG